MTVDQPEATTPVDLLYGGRALPAERCLQIAEALCRQVDQLHQQGQIHGQIDADHVQFDAGQTPHLVQQNGPVTFGGAHTDLERCPPELDISSEITLPTDLQQAQAKLRSAAPGMDARRIDVYQIGALVCGLATGGSVQAYADSPRIKSSVAASIRAVLDQTLGFDSPDRIQSCDQLAHLLGSSSVGWVSRPDESGAEEDGSGDPFYSQDQPQGADQGESAADTPDSTVEECLAPTRTYPHVGAADDSQAGESQAGDTAELTHVKHYRLLEVIGRGGMGVVYRAQDELLDRTVAVKLLRQDLVRDESFLKRFQAEAEAVARLHHPNIAAVYDNGEDQGRRFFAMQFIDGESLLERLRREGSLDVAEAVAIITQCLSALDAAHAERLVHRDVKPGNVLLEAETGRAYLADFGLVRRMDAQTRLTMTGAILGTTDYIPPEQARGQHLDGRADLYSLGVMFYQMLSGRLPFVADTPSAMVFQHAREEPFPLDEAAPDLPQPLVELVNRLLAKDPEDRPRDCQEVVEALTPYHPLPSRTRQLTSQVSAILLAAEPDSHTLEFALDRRYGRWQKARDRAATMFRRHAPDWIDALRTTGQHLEGAVAFCERRRRRLLALRDEGNSLLSELDELIETASDESVAEIEQSVAGDERSEPPENIAAGGSLRSTPATLSSFEAESSANADDQQAAENTHQAGEEQLAATQAQRNHIGQQLEELDLELAKVDARLAALRSQQVALENRLASLQKSASNMPTAAIAMAVSILLLFGILAGIYAWPTLTSLMHGPEQEEPPDGKSLPAGQLPSVESIVKDAKFLMTFDKVQASENANYLLDESGRGTIVALNDGSKLVDDGIAGKAINTGTGYLRLPKLLDELPAYTVAGWVRLPGEDLAKLHPVRRKLYSEHSTTGGLKYWIAFSGNKVSESGWNRDRPGDYWLGGVAASDDIAADRWVFVAATLSDGGIGRGNVRVHINDQMFHRDGQMVGHKADGFGAIGYQCTGDIDEVAIFDRELSIAEVRALYEHGRKGLTLTTPSEKTNE